MKLFSVVATLLVSGALYAQSSGDIPISDEWKVKPVAEGTPLILPIENFDLARVGRPDGSTYNFYEDQNTGKLNLKLPDSDTYGPMPEDQDRYWRSNISSWCDNHRREQQARDARGGIVGQIGNRIDSNLAHNRDVANGDITYTGVTRNDGTLVVLENEPDCSNYGGNFTPENPDKKKGMRIGSGGSMKKLLTVKVRW
jgi:hypothetical protein